MRAKAPGIFGWFFVLLMGSAQGCNSTPIQPVNADDGQRIWHTHHPADYQFVWQRTCFCTPEAVQPIRVVVRNGVIVAATDMGGAPVPDSVRSGLLTIDALYQRVLDGERAGAKVRFVYARDGVPGEIYVDPNPRVADDEFRVTITQFTPGADAPVAANIH